MVPIMAAVVMMPAQERAPVYRPGAYDQLIATRYTTNDGLPQGPITFVLPGPAGVVALSERGMAALKPGESRWSVTNTLGTLRPAPEARPPDGGRPRSWVKSRSGDWFVATDKGAFRQRRGQWLPFDLPRAFKPHQPQVHPDTEVRAVASDSAGHIWLATSQGVYITDGADWWQPLNRADGMPYEDLLTLAIAPNGDVWGGTTMGAWRLRRGEWRYFFGPRWLPSSMLASAPRGRQPQGSSVHHISFDGQGAVWLATDDGVAKIEERRMSLAEKAARYEEITNKRHNRRGWVTLCILDNPGQPESGFTHEASDNDGLWTAIYIGAEAFRYAATKSPESRALAKKSMEALLDLTRLSGFPGFPARAIIRKGEKVLGYNPDETVRVEGEPDKIWYTSPKDPNLLIKGDTSSDELDGHYFAFHVYHELVADAAEKKALADVVRAVTNNLLDNNYTLVGHTGRKTRWGVFGPQFINEDPRWFEERGLNSLSMLNYLKVAHSICGDRRFSDAYEDLIANHHYLINTLNYRRGLPWNEINHSDDELAYLGYYPLLMLEKDPQRRAILIQSIASTWTDIRHARSPFYNFIYGATTGNPCDPEGAVQTLQDWPWELVSWPVRNSHRHDVRLKTAQGGRARMELDRVLPMSERRTWRWNQNPYTPDGGDARVEEDGAAFLLPYWMGRYHGIIAE